MLVTVKPITPSEFVSHLLVLSKTYKEASLPKPRTEPSIVSPSIASPLSPDIIATILQQLQQMEQRIEAKMEAKEYRIEAKIDAKLKQIEELYSATSRNNSEGDATSAAPDFIEL
ncbi:hypothetical protein Syun_030690 [Stephania yunnanensis]|uniref:Uncharacterized protein n=1 Tax=Stephania yunnanensis TaxID=152371 RepID=A0AAP0DTT3_9MAGN